ncbi:hypothetical protein EON64_03515 [archaeon]|nr:MAG: hypothetical protein EON64_03515 [archaeon]
MEEGGMPRKALYYDFHCPAIEFKVQQSQKALMAAIYDTQILFWDPCHHPQPISYVRNGICLRNFHWSDDNEHTFCSSSSNNTVQIWDVRSPARPAKELVVGRRIEKLATCPANSHLIAANVENKAVVVWDSRMLSSTEAVSNEDSYCILDVPSPHAGQRNSGTKRFGLEQLPMSFNMALPLAEASVSDLSWYWRDGRCRLRVLQGSGSCSDTFISSGEGGKVVDSSWQPIGQYPELDKDFRMMDARFLQEDDAVVLFKQDYTGRRCRMYYMVEERSEAGKTGQENPSNNSNSSSSLCTSLIEAVSFRHRLLSCFYRNKKLLAVTEDGTLHSLAGVDKGSKPATSRDDLLFSSQIDAYQRRKRNSFPSLKSFLVSPEGQLDMRNLDSRRASKIISTERSGVVGPITFMHSMQEELIAIESGISNRHLEGVRIDAVDQFVRQLVLEVLLPRKERFAMAKKTYSTGSSNYYDSIELDNFSSASMSLAGRSIALIISFPAKVASFWHLKFFLENRSRTEVCRNITAHLMCYICMLIFIVLLIV